MTDFESLLRVLCENHVEFIVIGGVAANLHGSARLTKDLDVVYRRNPENMRRLADALRPYNPYPRGAPPGLPFIWDAETLERGLNFTLVTTLGDLDILGEVSGGNGFDALIHDTESANIFGHPCTCLNLQKLIEVKRAAGRPKDFEALAELVAIWDERKRRESPSP